LKSGFKSWRCPSPGKRPGQCREQQIQRWVVPFAGHRVAAF